MNHMDIQGWCDHGIEEIYDQLVSEASDGDIIIEIGVWKGCSFSYLCNKIKESGKSIVPYGIDTFSGCEYGSKPEMGVVYDEFKGNLESRGFMENVHWKGIIEDSIEASKLFEDNSVFAIFLDGCHVENYVKAEIEAWKPNVKIIAGHDYPQMGFVNEWLPGIEDRGSCYLWRNNGLH